MEGLLKGTVEEFVSLGDHKLVVVTDILPTKRGFRISFDVFPGKFFPVKPSKLFADMYTDFTAGRKVQLSFTEEGPSYTRGLF